MATPVPDALAPFAPDGQARAEAAFLDSNPRFRGTGLLDELRAAEDGRLDTNRDVSLDYTGGSLSAASQLEAHMGMLQSTVYGNPPSVTPTSTAATVLVERARAAVLRYFGANE